MDQEIRLVESAIADPKVRGIRGQRFVIGTLQGIQVVTAISGFGKTGAAATAGVILAAFDTDAVVFAGVAGGIHEDVQIGDVVVADRLIHHDMDASPIFDRHVVPSLGRAEMPTDPALTKLLVEAAQDYGDLSEPPGSQLTVHTGLIASGDRFISSEADIAALRSGIPDVLAVEMEGAAVAQVCTERDVPVVVFRSISDRADQDAEADFLSFVATVAAPLTAGVVAGFIRRLN